MQENLTRKPVQFQPVTIRASKFQPFSSRAGIDEVVRLKFPFDRALVSRLKALFEIYRHLTPYRNAGGWLAEYRCWFVEPTAWPAIRDELLWLGHSILREGQL